MRQDDNNNQKKFCDDLEENLGLLAPHGKGVKSSAADLTVDESMEKSVTKEDSFEMKDLPEQSENKVTEVNVPRIQNSHLKCSSNIYKENLTFIETKII